MSEVSVIIPAFNSGRFLRDAVDSALGQTFKDFEIFIVDDGSTDGSAAIIEAYGTAVRCIRQRNLGVSAARNAAVHESRGRYVAFLDADDVWDPAKIERQLAALGAAPEYRACYTALELVDEQLRTLGIRRSQRQGRATEDLLILGNVVSTPSSVMVERNLVLELGGFDPAMSYAADWDLWVRLSAHTDFLYLDAPLVKYRQHGGAMSGDVRLIERDNLRLLDKSFERNDVPASIRRRRARAYGRTYRVLSGIYFQARRPGDAIRCAAQAVIRDPAQARYIMALPLRRLRKPR